MKCLLILLPIFLSAGTVTVTAKDTGAAIAANTFGTGGKTITVSLTAPQERNNANACAQEKNVRTVHKYEDETLQSERRHLNVIFNNYKTNTVWTRAMTDFYNELKEGYLTVSWDRANENEDEARNRINCVAQKVLAEILQKYSSGEKLVELSFFGYFLGVEVAEQVYNGILSGGHNKLLLELFHAILPPRSYDPDIATTFYTFYGKNKENEEPDAHCTYVFNNDNCDAENEEASCGQFLKTYIDFVITRKSMTVPRSGNWCQELPLL